MKYEKKKYEELITSSPLFSLDNDSSAFRRERYKMIEYLYCYLMAVNAESYEPYGCEIMEIASRCIQNFDPDKGVFLHYFNKSWKQEFKHICGEDSLDKSLQGIRITEEEKKAVKRFVKFFSQSNPQSGLDDRFHQIAEAMALPVDRVKELAELANISVTSDIVISSDEEEASIFDIKTDGNLVEDRLMRSEHVTELLMKIDNCFIGLQARQKMIVSDLITAKICELLSEEHIAPERYSFISRDLYQEYLKYGLIPTQREIAAKYMRNEASISRTMKDFLIRLKAIM